MTESVSVTVELISELREAITSKPPPRTPSPGEGPFDGSAGGPRFGSIYFGRLSELSRARRLQFFSTKKRYWMVKGAHSGSPSPRPKPSVPLAPITSQPRSASQQSKILELPPGFLHGHQTGRGREYGTSRVLLRITAVISLRSFRANLELVRPLDEPYLSEAKRKLGYE